MKRLPAILVCLWALSGCTISYRFNGANIDYTKTKSISIVDFPNNAALVYPQLSTMFTEELRDLFARQTRLQLLRSGGNMNIEGEITGYTLTPMAISADSYASQTKLTITVRVRFTNNASPEDDFERTYSAFQNFDSSRMLTEVQEELCQTISKEIAENIYNDTVAKW